MRKSDFTLPKLDDLFTTQEMRDDAKLERVQNMGDKLQAVNKAYGAVYEKAKRGQSVLGSAQKLVKLGAKASSVHALPPEDEEDRLPELPSIE